MADNKSKFFKGGGYNYYTNNKEMYFTQIFNNTFEVIDEILLGPDEQDYRVIILSEEKNGDNNVGGTKKQTIVTNDGQTKVYNSYIIKFIDDNNQLSPTTMLPDPLGNDVTTKEQFVNIRSLYPRGLREPEMLDAMNIGSITIGFSAVAYKKEGLWFLREISPVTDEKYKNFVENLGSFKSASDNFGQGSKPAASGGSIKSPDPGPGKRDLPSFTGGACPNALNGPYKSLEQKRTTFQKYNEDEVISAIKNSGQPDYIQKTMWAIIKQEQPKFSFPNNNVAGIQTDGGMFDGTSVADYDYHTCFHDKEAYRAFAGFNTLDKGMKVFGKQVAAKYSNLMTGWITPPAVGIEETSSDAAAITYNYFRNWTLSAKPEEIKDLKKQGFFTRNGKQYKKNYTSTFKNIEKNLKIWESK